MKLLTKELEKRFQEIGSQENESDPIVVAKYFYPGGSVAWLATEYIPEDKVFFGYVAGLIPDPDKTFDEYGYFSLSILESIKCPPLYLPIERDLYCGEKRISEHCPELAEKIKRREELREMEKQKEQSLDNDIER